MKNADWERYTDNLGGIIEETDLSEPTNLRNINKAIESLDTIIHNRGILRIINTGKNT